MEENQLAVILIVAFLIFITELLSPIDLWKQSTEQQNEDPQYRLNYEIENLGKKEEHMISVFSTPKVIFLAS